MGFFRKRAVNGKERATAEREAAERRLRHAQTQVIVPLRQLREHNHVSEVIEALIQRRVQRGGGR